MKKIFFAIVLSMGMTAAIAQSKTSASASYNVDQMSSQMMSDYGLDEAQYIRVKSINRDRVNRMTEIDRMYANDPQMRQQKLDALNSEFDSRYQEVFRGEQYQSYLNAQGRGTTAQPGTSTGNSDILDATMPAGNSETDMVAPDGSMGIQGDTKIKVEQGEKMKVESPNGEMKIKDDKEKVKTGDAKYKYEDDKTKIQNSSDNSKVKVKDDKLKAEDKNGKLKVEDDKVKVKSRD